MSEQKSKKCKDKIAWAAAVLICGADKDKIAWAAAVLICGTVFASTFYIYPAVTPKEESIVASAEENTKRLQWTKLAVDEGTTIDAAYLWPDEANASFMAVYRDGEELPESKMVTVTAGSEYHFRGISDDSVLYTQVYVGVSSVIDISSGETGMWYRLLPSIVRDNFEADGWTWQTGWEYTGRAYLDTENNRVMIKSNDASAVLYGVGLYLDNKYNYTSNDAFVQESDSFITAFGNTENLFASALEQYYTRGGELKTKCPAIYAMVASAMFELDDGIVQMPGNTDISEPEESEDSEETGPVLLKDLLEYVNIQRDQVGLSSVSWDSADDDNILVRLSEVSILFSQTRLDGTDAFSAYTDAVMCEMRIADVTSMESIFDCAESYFLSGSVTSFNCAVDGNTAVLIFVW